MGRLDIGGLWCPVCAAEYRPGFVECSDCHVALTTDKPAPRPRRPVDTGEHDQATYDLTDWSDDQRGALNLMLQGAEVPHGWESGVLVVPRNREVDVVGYIDVVAEGKVVDDIEVAETTGASGAREEPVRSDLAGVGRRFGGFICDGTILAAMARVVDRGVLRLDSSSPLGLELVVPVLIAAYYVVLTAVWGRTLGKLIVGTRVIVLADGSVPGWRRATVRWVVPGGPLFLVVGGLPGSAARIVVSLLANLWMWVVYAPILWTPLEQGLHDKAAGTIVVRTKSPRESPATAGL